MPRFLRLEYGEVKQDHAYNNDDRQESPDPLDNAFIFLIEEHRGIIQYGRDAFPLLE